jgi:hypothetical protein
MRLRRHTLLTMVTGLAGGLVVGCSAAPSLTPQFGGTASLVAEERPGYRGHAYVPTAEERTADCRQIAYILGRSIQAINGMPALAKSQKEAPPSNLMYAAQRISGGGLPVLEDYKRERARMKTFVQLGEQKKCPAIDVDSQTKAAHEKMAAFRKG